VTTPKIAKDVFKLGRVTSQQPENPHSTEPEILDTEVIAVAAPAPVFVDSTGRRSRLLRRLAWAFGVVVMLYGGLISVSLAGGPVSSSAVLPLPGLETDENDGRAPARPSPAPSPSQSSKSLFVAEALPRRAGPSEHASAARVESAKVPPKPAPKPTTSKTPKPSPSTSHPVESTTTPATSGSPTTTPTGTTTTPTRTPAPPTKAPTVAPVPPAGGGSGGSGTTDDTGGQGGGSGDETGGGSGGTPSGSGSSASASEPAA
jgi:hypothetical protein